MSILDQLDIQPIINSSGIKEVPIRLSFQERSAAMAREALKILKEKKDWGVYGFAGYGNQVHTDKNRSYYIRPNTMSMDSEPDHIAPVEDPITGIINHHWVHVTGRNIHKYPSSITILLQFTDRLLESKSGNTFGFNPEFKGFGFILD